MGMGLGGALWPLSRPFTPEGAHLVMGGAPGRESAVFAICGGCGSRVPRAWACQVCQKWPLSGVSR